MPVRAFVDDSGSGGDSRYFVLGGFMADYDTWERFSDAWDAELRRAPSLKLFRMAQANALNGHFDGWTEAERDQKVNSLIDVIHAHDPFMGTCAISTEDYDAIVGPVLGDRFKGQYNDP